MILALMTAHHVPSCVTPRYKRLGLEGTSQPAGAGIESALLATNLQTALIHRSGLFLLALHFVILGVGIDSLKIMTLTKNILGVQRSGFDGVCLLYTSAAADDIT